MIVKHFMLGPGWQEGWIGCSFEVDHVDGALVHLEHHDVSYVAVSRAPVAEIETYKKRMVWLLIGAYNYLDLTPKAETRPVRTMTSPIGCAATIGMTLRFRAGGSHSGCPCGEADALR